MGINRTWGASEEIELIEKKDLSYRNRMINADEEMEIVEKKDLGYARNVGSNRNLNRNEDYNDRIPMREISHLARLKS